MRLTASTLLTGTFFDLNFLIFIDLFQELQVARECALLGNYDTSLLYFESVIQAISQ